MTLISIVTKHDGDFLVWFLERISVVFSGEDDYRSIKSCSEPRDVSMPEQRAPLPRDGEVIRVALATLYRTLCYIRRSISPSALELPYSMPAPYLSQLNQAMLRKSRKLPIDTKNALRAAQSCHVVLHNLAQARPQLAVAALSKEERRT